MPRARESVPRKPISCGHAASLNKLAPCSFLPGGRDKRFVLNLSGAMNEATRRGDVFEISDRQAENIDRLAHINAARGASPLWEKGITAGAFAK